MTVKHVLVSVSLAFLLAACASKEERVARMVAEDDAACQSYGFEKGTDAYAECRIRMADRRLDDAARQRAAWGNLTGYGLWLYNSAQPQPRTTTHCVRTHIGVDCTTY
jgi:hypothetical protein